VGGQSRDYPREKVTKKAVKVRRGKKKSCCGVDEKAGEEKNKNFISGTRWGRQKEGVPSKKGNRRHGESNNEPGAESELLLSRTVAGKKVELYAVVRGPFYGKGNFISKKRGEIVAGEGGGKGRFQEKKKRPRSG